MKWLVSALLVSLSLPCALQAKGLDKLQPTTEEEKEEAEKDRETKEEKGIVDRDVKTVPAAEGKAVAPETKVEATDAKKGEVAGKKAPVKEPEIPVEPGFQAWYLGTSLNWINTDGPEGDWHSSSTADLELGYRVMKKWLEHYDLYATLRYRPVDVTIELEQRAYRGILESYLAGVKAQREISSSLFLVGSAEIGLSRTSVSAIDGVQKVDGSLEKSSVDLTVGGGVSYLILEKLALGTQLHLGVGAHKTVQFGLDLRFLL
ncbi:MAG: hypothetical protein EOP10_02525 [Proteobacteria bacterium]|nr:MAG: hypothetical protein EOP10_02525 [Pseudomonadota bacterium]